MASPVRAVEDFVHVTEADKVDFERHLLQELAVALKEKHSVDLLSLDRKDLKRILAKNLRPARRSWGVWCWDATLLCAPALVRSGCVQLALSSVAAQLVRAYLLGAGGGAGRVYA